MHILSAPQTRPTFWATHVGGTWSGVGTVYYACCTVLVLYRSCITGALLVCHTSPPRPTCRAEHPGRDAGGGAASGGVSPVRGGSLFCGGGGAGYGGHNAGAISFGSLGPVGQGSAQFYSGGGNGRRLGTLGAPALGTGEPETSGLGRKAKVSLEFLRGGAQGHLCSMTMGVARKSLVRRTGSGPPTSAPRPKPPPEKRNLVLIRASGAHLSATFRLIKLPTGPVLAIL